MLEWTTSSAKALWTLRGPNCWDILRTAHPQLFRGQRRTRGQIAEEIRGRVLNPPPYLTAQHREHDVSRGVYDLISVKPHAVAHDNNGELLIQIQPYLGLESNATAVMFDIGMFTLLNDMPAQTENQRLTAGG